MSIEYDYHHLHHVKEQSKSRKTLWVTLILTAFFTIVEIVGGVLSNSLALAIRLCPYDLRRHRFGTEHGCSEAGYSSA